MKKTFIHEKIHLCDVKLSYDYLDGTPEHVIEKLKNLDVDLKTHYSWVKNLAEATDYVLEFDHSSGWGCDDCNTNLIVKCYRIETDDELQARIDAHKKASVSAKKAAATRKLKEQQEAIAKELEELALFQRLKKKYENSKD